jgi:hypothetical protein
VPQLKQGLPKVVEQKYRLALSTAESVGAKHLNIEHVKLLVQQDPAVFERWAKFLLSAEQIKHNRVKATKDESWDLCPFCLERERVSLLKPSSDASVKAHFEQYHKELL